MKSLWAEVRCDKHGKTEAGSENWKPKSVIVSVPKTKRESVAGCPFCKGERITERKNK